MVIIYENWLFDLFGDSKSIWIINSYQFRWKFKKAWKFGPTSMARSWSATIPRVRQKSGMVAKSWHDWDLAMDSVTLRSSLSLWASHDVMRMKSLQSRPPFHNATVLKICPKWKKNKKVYKCNHLWNSTRSTVRIPKWTHQSRKPKLAPSHQIVKFDQIHLSKRK